MAKVSPVPSQNELLEINEQEQDSTENNNQPSFMKSQT